MLSSNNIVNANGVPNLQHHSHQSQQQQQQPQQQSQQQLQLDLQLQLQRQQQQQQQHQQQQQQGHNHLQLQPQHHQHAQQNHHQHTHNYHQHHSRHDEEKARLRAEQRARDIINHQDNIFYSARYYDDQWEYRHVTLPKAIARYVPNELMTEEEWKSLGVKQSHGWVHYMIHSPEPHVLLFKREKDYQLKYPNGIKQP